VLKGDIILSLVLKNDIILSLVLKVTLVLLSRKITEIADLNVILIRMCAFRN
jgi:hypothetical protein